MMSRKDLPLDIIEAILSLLPSKSLGRFKSVSKTWNSLISDSQFVKYHVRQNRKQTKLIVIRYANSLYSIDTDEFLPYLKTDDDIPSTPKELCLGLLPIQWNTSILRSCNGLVLSTNGDNMCVTNPTTRELWKLPPEPVNFRSPNTTGRFSMRYGFGYDSSTDDYKVVRIWFFVRFDHAPTYNVIIYSLRNNSWRELPIAPHEYPSFDCARDGVVVNHNSHWTAKSSIVAFSFVDEVFTKIERPNSYQYKKVGFYDKVVEIGGRLGVFIVKSDWNELWVMQEYGDASSWTRVYSHDKVAKPVCLVDGSDRNIVLNDNNEVVVFNIDERRYRKVRIVGEPSRFTIVGTAVESIESPKRIITTP